MVIENTIIDGLKVLHLNDFKDQRGSFIKVLNSDFFLKNNLVTDYKESYYTISSKNVIRGMHFQVPPSEHTKLVYVNAGEIMDVILDIRTKSPSYGKFVKVHINALAPKLIYIPVGCAHGFQALKDHTIVTYLQTTCYDPACDKGVRYDSFGMEWGVENPIISERDLSFPVFNEIKFNF